MTLANFPDFSHRSSLKISQETLCPFCSTLLQAFDMQRDLQITPRRLEYTREKEGELFTSLMAIANRKQEEMKEMIVETLGSMKEQLLEDAANLEFTG